MAVAEPWTEVYDTPNKSIRQNVPRLGAVLHHAAMTNLDELIRLEMGAKQVSSTATCKDNRLPRMMPLDIYRAWSLSDAYWDSALRSVETCNESTNGWTVSDASHWSLARMVAYLAERDGFWPHRDGDQKTWTVIGHREVYSIHGGSYATACPGGMDLNLVTTRAQQILRGVTTAGGQAAPIEEETEMPIVSRGGALHFIDELGVDKVADFVSSDMSNAEVVNGLNVVFGNYQDYGLRTFDVVAALVQRRWARKLGEIAAAVAVGVKPDITQAELDLAVKRAIPAGALDFKVDDAAAQKIAEFVQNEQDARDRVRLGNEQSPAT